MANFGEQDSFETWHLRLFFVWLFIYMVFQGEDGYFSVTAERIDVEWVRWTFLYLPLQLALAAVVAFGAGRYPRVARLAALLNSGLVGGHVALSVATA